MKIRHVPLHNDLAMFLFTGRKHVTRRPMKPQPAGFDAAAGVLLFGGEEAPAKVYLEDYPCPFGEPGEMILYYFEGNPHAFHEAKVMRRGVERLQEISDAEVAREGFTSRQEFIEFWDLLYGDTIFASIFNPWVWAVSHS